MALLYRTLPITKFLFSTIKILEVAILNNKCDKTSLIFLSDYYTNNCSEQECIEVKDEILEAYKEFQEIDRKLDNWDRNHRKKIIFDEIYIGEILGKRINSYEEYISEKIFIESLMSLCGKTIFRRSMQYYWNGRTLQDIADEENISVSAVSKSVKTFKMLMCKIYEISLE